MTAASTNLKKFKHTNMADQKRIYNWLDSQLSIARHYGGCKLNGVDYAIAYDEEGQPLVRRDVLEHERKAKRKANHRKLNIP